MTTPEPRLAAARALAKSGRIDDAAAAYRELQDIAPLEASDFLGAYALRCERWSDAVGFLGRAAQLAPGNPGTLENLGLALERAGEAEKAAETFRQVLAARPDFFVSRLLLGLIHLRLGQPLTAYAHMHWAMRQARQRGFWEDDRTTPPWLRQDVAQASAFVARYPHDTLFGMLREARAPLPRVEAFIRSELGEQQMQSPDPRQRPKRHYFPGLPAAPWFTPEQLPWTRRLQEAFPEILAEYLAVAGAAGSFEPFLDLKSAEQVARYLGTNGPAPEWNAFFFYRHGVRNDANCARCPKTAALLDELPLIRLPQATPEICFSVLTPGAHILPHRGDSNMRSVVHLGLVVPPSCALKVAGEARGWEPGGILAFDDTYEHEAWNHSDRIRAVLLMDAWNPHLADDERRVIPDLIGAMNGLITELDRLKPPLS